MKRRRVQCTWRAACFTQTHPLLPPLPPPLLLLLLLLLPQPLPLQLSHLSTEMWPLPLAITTGSPTPLPISWRVEGRAASVAPPPTTTHTRTPFPPPLQPWQMPSIGGSWPGVWAVPLRPLHPCTPPLHPSTRTRPPVMGEVVGVGVGGQCPLLLIPISMQTWLPLGGPLHLWGEVVAVVASATA